MPPLHRQVALLVKLAPARDTGAAGMKDMGKVMAALKAKHASTLDMALVHHPVLDASPSLSYASMATLVRHNAAPACVITQHGALS